jgi:hypothetical protein
MDTRTRTGARIVLLALAALTLAGGWDHPESKTASIGLDGASPKQRAIVEWALGRYERAGLELPRIDIAFHADPAGCRGNSGFYSPGRLDVCSTDDRDYARKVVVHELAHAWAAANLTADDRERFLGQQGLEEWSSWDVPWGMRGFERAAEIITWGVGDRSMRPLLPDRDPDHLEVAYRMLTGRAAPEAPAE